MTLIDFPAAVDTFTDPDAGAGDHLDTPGVEHDEEHAKKNQAITALQRITVGPTYLNLKADGSGNGVDNDSAAIAAILTDGETGGVIRVPAGEYMVDPGVMAMLVKRAIWGDGGDTTWFTLRSDTSGAALSLEVVGAGVRGAYGTRIRGIGINLVNAPNATGIQLGSPGGDGLKANWTHLDDVRVEGGKKALDCQAVNVKLTNFHFVNPTEAFIVIHPTGQEFRCYDGVLECSPGVTVPTAIDIPILVGGPAGACYFNQVELNNGGIVNRGIYAHCPDGSTASVPVRCIGVTLDNLSGPGYDLVNVTDAQIMGGWVNSAAGTTNGAVRFFGGGAHTFMGVQQLNGGSTGGCTFDFAGGTPTGIVLIGNTPATGPIYRISATGKPLDLLIQDRISTLAAIANVTNDPEWLRLACTTRLWTPQVHAQRLYVRETGTDPPAGYDQLGAGGLKTVLHGGVTANTRVRVWRERPGGTVGELYSSVVDNNVGVAFQVRSTNAADTSSFYWELYDPA